MKTIKSKLIVETISFVILLILCYISMTSFEWTFKSGFWCSDTSINYPLLIDGNMTHLFLLIVNLLAPIIIIVFIQIITFITALDKFILLKFFITMYQIILTFLNGLLITIFLTYILKIFSGKLTPYFLHICQPNINCSLEKNQNLYHVNYTCIDYCRHSIQYNHLLESRLSFVSIHSSMTTYSMFYLIQLLQLKFGATVKYKSFLILIQLQPILLSIYVCNYVVNYHLHHWQDVVIGCLLGLIVSYIFKYKENIALTLYDRTSIATVTPSVISYANSGSCNSIE